MSSPMHGKFNFVEKVKPPPFPTLAGEGPGDEA